MIRGLSEEHAQRIVDCREQERYTTLDEFSQRTGLSNAVLKRLSKADAFGSLGLERRQAMWQSLPSREPAPLYETTLFPEPPATLPEMPMPQQIVADYQSAGLSLKGHPIQFLRTMLDELKVVPTCRLADLPPDRRYKVAGIVLLRQRPGTAKGITFVTIEDETGTANLIVRQGVWEKYHTVAARAGAFIASGKLQRAHEVIHLLVDRLEDMTSLLADLNTRSRDFR
jgi:error-prone DNA polymerase